MLSLNVLPVFSPSARPTRLPWIALVILGLATALSPARSWAQSPPSTAPAPEVRLTVVTGRVEVMAPGTRSFAPALADTVLPRGARVRTGEGRAELTLADGVTFALDPQSLLTIYGSAAATPPGVPPSTTTTLQRGTLRFAAPPANANRPESIPVATQALTVFMGRADGVLTAELGGHITRVASTRGRLRVRFGTNEYLLPALHSVREEEGRPPAVMRVLPRAPEWRRQPNTRQISFGEPVDVEGTFGPGRRGPAGTAVTGYRVDIARDERFRQRLGEQHLGPRETLLRFRSLNPGTWYIRLFSTDADHFESLPSSVARIEIAAPRVEPGELATATRPGHRAALVIPNGFYCSLDGSPFATAERPRPLDPARAYALRCGTAADGHDARATTIAADQVGPVAHLVRVNTPTASANGPTATSTVSIDLHDAEGRPISLATVEVAGDPGVAIDPLREAEPRGRYTAGAQLPRALRELHLRFTVNRTLTIEDSIEVPEAVVPAPVAPPPTATTPPTVQVIRAAQPFRHPEDEDPPTDEE